MRQQAALQTEGADLSGMSPLMVPKPSVRTITLVVVGADRGLCGGHNLALGRAARAFVLERTAKGCEVSAQVKGRRAETYLRRTTQVPILDASAWTRAGVTDGEVDALLEVVVGRFLGGQADEVWACYTAYPVDDEPGPGGCQAAPGRAGDRAGGHRGATAG